MTDQTGGGGQLAAGALRSRRRVRAALVDLIDAGGQFSMARRRRSGMRLWARAAETRPCRRASATAMLCRRGCGRYSSRPSCSRPLPRQGVLSFLRLLQGVEVISILSLCGRRRRAARQFWWCESNVAHSEIFCFGQGRFWRRQAWAGGVQPKMGVSFRQSYGQMAGLGDPRRGTKGHEG